MPTALPLSSTSTEPGSDPAPPVLAVVLEEGCYRGVLDRGLALAAQQGSPLAVVVLRQRLRFAADAALLGYLDRRLQQRLDTLHAALDRRPDRPPTTVQVLAHGDLLTRDPLGSAWRAVDARADGVGARLVVVPWLLSETAWAHGRSGDRWVVAVPDEADDMLTRGGC